MTDTQNTDDLPERRLSTRFRYSRTEGERERDLEEISTLYLRGLKPQEIADELVKRHHYENLTGRTIYNELVELRKLWVQSALIKYDEAKAREIARIDELEAAAWVAWNASQGHQDTTVVEDIEDKFGHDEDTEEKKDRKPSTYTRKRTNKTTKEIPGDPRFLDKISWCIDERCKILGLHEPMRLAISWQSEAQKAGLSEEEAQKLYNDIVYKTTKELRDAYLKNNQVEMPSEILDIEFEDTEEDEPADDESK